MALAVIGMLISGVFMLYTDIPKDVKFALYQMHKSTGVCVLIALIIRIILRLKAAIPPLPAHIRPVEITLAKLGHIGLYAALIAMVTSGWVMVSSNPYGLATRVFDWFTWPHIPGLSDNKSVHALGKTTHTMTAIGLTGLLIAHVAAVIKHAIIDHENLLDRMSWRHVSLSGHIITVLTLLLLGFAIITSIPRPSDTLQTLAPQAGAPQANTARSPQHSPAPPIRYSVDAARSSIRFKGTHAGAAFSGHFPDWTADIRFHPHALSDSSITTDITLTSVTTEQHIYQDTLKQAAWLDTETYPKARFSSTKITATDRPSTYRVDGELTLKGTTQPVHFIMSLSPLTQPPIIGKATLSLDRFAFNIGNDAAPNGEWVGPTLTLTLLVTASPE